MLFPPPSSGPKHRVVITGAGLVTAFGLDWNTNAEGFRLGRTAFTPVTLFDVSRQRAKMAAQVTLPASAHPNLPSRRWARLDRGARMLVWAAGQALEQARWSTPLSSPIILGTTSGGMSLGEAYYRQAVQCPHRKRQQPSRVIHYLVQRPALDLAQAFGITGPITIIANACASGANALGHAWQCLRSGCAERIVTGGYDELSHLVFAGFDSLQALSPACCRPFDAYRDGLALGEGAAVLTLETLQSAENRGAEILGEIAGYGAATDTHHLTQPHPEGEAAFASMSAACQSAGITPRQVDYINAHGTGTPLNDAAETAAINRWAGPHAARLSVSSTKAGIGHLLGAAGAVEALVCVMALRGQWLPPTATVQTPEPAAQFALVREPASAKLEYALSNSFGFGGANASLILRRWP